MTSTPNRIGEPAVRPALGGLADVALAVGERREPVGRHRRVEVDVVGDRELRRCRARRPGRSRPRAARSRRASGPCGGARRAAGRAPFAEPGGDAREVDLVLDLGPRARVGRGVLPGDRHPPITPSSRPTRSNASSARSSMLVGVRGGHDRPDPRLVEGDGREHHGRREHALLEQPAGEPDRRLARRPGSRA